MIDETVTAVYDSKFNPMFATATSMRVQMTEDAKVMTHPLENGSQITDHIVINPIKLDLVMILPVDEYKNVYQAIRTAFRTGKLFTVVTKTGTYPSMLLSGIPHEENPDMMNRVAMNLQFDEAKFVAVTYTPGPRKSSNKTTVKRGEQPPKESVLHRIFG